MRRHFFQDGGGEIAGAVQMPADYYLGIGAYGEAADRVRNYLMERHETEFSIFEEAENEPCRVFPLLDENQKPFGIFGARISHQHYFETVRLLEI